MDYDLKIRRAVSKLNPLLKDGLTPKEFCYQKKTAEERRNEWIRKAAEHGSMEAQYYLVLLYPDPDYYKTGDKDATEFLIHLEENHKAGSYGDAVLWLLKAEAQGYLPAQNLILQLGKEVSEERDRFHHQKEKEKNAGLLKKILGKKTAEKPVKEEFKIPALSLARPFHPGFIGLCHLADAGVSEAQMLKKAIEMQKTSHGIWNLPHGVAIQKPWSFFPDVMQKEKAQKKIWLRLLSGTNEPCEEESPRWMTRQRIWMKKKNKNCFLPNRSTFWSWMMQ